MPIELLVLWSCGPVVLWSCGPVVLWSCGPVVLWSCGPVVLWSCGPVVLWSCKTGEQQPHQLCQVLSYRAFANFDQLRQHDRNMFSFLNEYHSLLFAEVTQLYRDVELSNHFSTRTLSNI